MAKTSTTKKSSAPTVKYDTKTGKKLSAGQSTMVGGQSVKAGSAYTGPNAFGSSSTKINYDTKTGSMLSPGQSTTYAGKTATQGQDIKDFASQPISTDTKGGAQPITPTAQPNATQTQPTQAGVVPFEQASQALAAGMKGSPATAIKSATDAMRQKYYGGFNAATSTGQQAPPTIGQAGSMMQQTTPPTEPDTSFIDQALEGDSFMTGLMDTITEFMEPTNQRDTLVKEYERLEKASGLEGIDKELLDARNIIEGTEDDIRNEVTKAGGFATESQVQAMTLARNKSLIKNYNNLLETRNNIQARLDTMMSLTKEDKKMAQEKLASQLDLAFKMEDFKVRAKENAQQQFRWLASQPGGYEAIQAASSDPYYAKLIDKTFGGSGGLNKLAASAQKAQSLEDRYKQAQIDSMYSQIAERNSDNTVMVDTSGKVILQPKEAMRINKEITQNDAFKAITKAKDSLQFLKQFEDTFNQTGATSAVFSPRQNSKLKAQYNTAILNLKEFFNLGVLNGPDEKILKGVLPDPTNRSAFLTGVSAGIYRPGLSTKSGIESMKKMIESTIDERYKSLTSQYGDYSGQSVGAINDLKRTYVEQKVKVNPEVQRMLEENPDLTEEDVINILTE